MGGILTAAGAMSGVLAGTLVAGSAVGNVEMGVSMPAGGGKSETSRSKPTSDCGLSSWSIRSRRWTLSTPSLESCTGAGEGVLSSSSGLGRGAL